MAEAYEQRTLDEVEANTLIDYYKQRAEQFDKETQEARWETEKIRKGLAEANEIISDYAEQLARLRAVENIADAINIPFLVDIVTDIEVALAVDAAPETNQTDILEYGTVKTQLKDLQQTLAGKEE